MPQQLTLKHHRNYQSINILLIKTNFSFNAAEVKRVFGGHMLDYILGLCRGNYDYISRISDPLQIYIISFLELEDIGHLAQTSKHFYKVYIFFELSQKLRNNI